MKQRQTILLLCVSLPICVTLRIMQLIFTIDGATGFIKQQYATIGALITVIVCAAIAAVCLISITGEAVVKKDNPHMFVAIPAMFAGAAFFYRAITGVLALNKSGLGSAFIVLLALLSAVVFVMLGLREMLGKKMPSIILVIPVIYYIAELISVFVSTSSLALITENVFLIFCTCAILLFVFDLASFENEIGNMDKKPKRLLASGLVAFMMCVVTAVPKLALALFTKIQVSHNDVVTAILDIALGAFIIAYVLCNFDDKSANKKIASKHSA